MLDKFFVLLTNLIYLIPFQVRKFKEQEPEAVVLAAGATKAQRLTDNRDVQIEAGWITARRAALILTTEKLVCGDWVIPLDSVTKAALLRVQSTSSRGYVLKVSTQDNAHYQFGLQLDLAWERQTALKLTVEEEEIKPTQLGRVFRLLRSVVVFVVCGWLAIFVLIFLRAQMGVFH